MEPNISTKEKLMKWAATHAVEWDIVCGIQATGTQNNLRIMNMLRDEGLPELSDMMMYRINRYIYDDTLNPPH